MVAFNYAGWKLTFSDEFTKFDPVGGPWAKTYPWGGLAATTNEGNNELQAYVNPNYKGTSNLALGLNPFSIIQDPTDPTDGILQITARPTPSNLQQYVKDSHGNTLPYVSGMLSSYSSFEQKFGYFEMRADLPGGKGTWPAFWMLPKDRTWPPELDVMEVIGSKPNVVYGTSHTAQDGSHTYHSAWKIGPDLTTGFHTYGAEWNKNEIIWYLDGQEYGRTSTPADMQKSMYLIANLAVGGDWPGSPDAQTPFPAEMKIDYIKAYSKDAGTSIPSPTLPTDPSTPTSGDFKLPTSADATKYISGGRGNDTLTGTTGHDQINGGRGSDTMTGRTGDDTYVVNSALDKVIEKAGEGVDTILTSVGGSFRLPNYVENLTFANSAGGRIGGNIGNNIITGNVGSDTINGGAGNDILIGKEGNDIYVIVKGNGSDVIADFHAGSGSGDTIKLVGYDFASFSGVKAAMTQNGSDVTLALNSSEKLHFDNVSLQSFDVNDFILDKTPPNIGSWYW
jgi:beta-glucanase (GH16 family)